MTQATLTQQLLAVSTTLMLIYATLTALEAAVCTLQKNASAFRIKLCACQDMALAMDMAALPWISHLFTAASASMLSALVSPAPSSETDKLDPVHAQDR